MKDLGVMTTYRHLIKPSGFCAKIKKLRKNLKTLKFMKTRINLLNFPKQWGSRYIIRVFALFNVFV